MSMFWRVFAANAAILIAGALTLAFAPGPLHKHTAVIDLTALMIGLLVMLVVNGLLLRRLFVPLERLRRGWSERTSCAAVNGAGRQPRRDRRAERAFNG